MADVQSHTATTHSELDGPMSQLFVGNPSEGGSSCKSILSAFEQLPGELFREIVQYVPESVFDLRLTSRATRSQVDSFGIACANVEIVELVMIKVEAPTTINFGVHVPDNKKQLFELRLRLRMITLSIGHDCPYVCSRIYRRNQDGQERKVYKINCDLLKDAKLLEFLIDCCGRRIGALQLIDCADIQKFITISKMLDQTRIRGLSCEMSQFTDPIATQVLSVIRANSVERLALTVRDNVCVDPAAVLIEMASLVRCMRIFFIESDRFETMFGISDWAPVILAIFSANVDTLHLVAVNSPYFGLAAVELLKERLPHLGKKLFFVAMANGCRNTRKFGVNGHLFKLTPETMSMKHWSRVDERPW